MPPRRRCICQHEDPNSPYPPGSDGCIVEPQPRLLTEPVSLEAVRAAVVADSGYVPQMERLVRADKLRLPAGEQRLALEARPHVSAADVLRELFQTEVEN